jgi:hypothetical protein
VQSAPAVDVGWGCDLSGNIRKGEIVVVVFDKSTELRYDGLWFSNAQTEMFDPKASSGEQLFASIAESGPRSPSVTYLRPSMSFGVAWRDGIRTYYGEITVSNCNTFYTAVNPTLETVSLDSDTCVFAPSLTINAAGQSVCAYEVTNRDLQTHPYSHRWINIRTRSDVFGWSTTDYMVPVLSDLATQYGEPLHPSLGAHETSTTCGSGIAEHGLRVAYNQNWGGGTRVIKLDCDPEDLEQSDEASFPSICEFTPNGKLIEVYSVPSQSPYSYAIRSTNHQLAKNSTNAMTMVFQTSVSSDTSNALIGVMNPSIASTTQENLQLSWAGAHDTLVIGCGATLEEKMRTAAFVVPVGASLNYERVAVTHQPLSFATDLAFELLIVRVTDSAVLVRDTLTIRSLDADTVIWTTVTIPLTSYVADSVYLAFALRGDVDSLGIGTQKVYIDHRDLSKAVPRESVRPRCPAECSLEQNYPNPFSSVSIISYAISSPSHVRIALNDLMGREVQVLEDGDRIAGRHSSTIHADRLPTGTYICILSANKIMMTRIVTIIR